MESVFFEFSLILHHYSWTHVLLALDSTYSRLDTLDNDSGTCFDSKA